MADDTKVDCGLHDDACTQKQIAFCLNQFHGQRPMSDLHSFFSSFFITPVSQVYMEIHGVTGKHPLFQDVTLMNFAVFVECELPRVIQVSVAGYLALCVT